MFVNVRCSQSLTVEITFSLIRCDCLIHEMCVGRFTGTLGQAKSQVYQTINIYKTLLISSIESLKKVFE